MPLPLHTFERSGPLAQFCVTDQSVSMATGPQTDPDTISAQVNSQFMDMLNAYRPSGGLLRAQEAATRCKRGSGTDVHALAGWIIERKLVSFAWLSQIWLPFFQFNRLDMSRLSGLEEVLSELVTVHDDWEVANWLSRPNAWLAGCLPSEAMATDAQNVLQAARAERYLIAG